MKKWIFEKASKTNMDFGIMISLDTAYGRFQVYVGLIFVGICYTYTWGTKQ